MTVPSRDRVHEEQVYRQEVQQFEYLYKGVQKKKCLVSGSVIFTDFQFIVKDTQSVTGYSRCL